MTVARRKQARHDVTPFYHHAKKSGKEVISGKKESGKTGRPWCHDQRTARVLLPKSPEMQSLKSPLPGLGPRTLSSKDSPIFNPNSHARY